MAERFVLNETSYFGRGSRVELSGEIKKRGFLKFPGKEEISFLRQLYW